MAVKDLDKKLNALAEPASAKAVNDAKWRRENKDWLAKSFDIALGVLTAMKAKGWNQKKLAEEMDVSEQQVSKIVKGKENFTLQSISKLEGVLGVRLMQTSLLENVQVANFSAIQKPFSVVSNKGYTTIQSKTTQSLNSTGELTGSSEWTIKIGDALKVA